MLPVACCDVVASSVSCWLVGGRDVPATTFLPVGIPMFQQDEAYVLCFVVLTYIVVLCGCGMC